MTRSKQKVGKRFRKSGGVEEAALDDDVTGAVPDKKEGAKPSRPQREMRERIEVRDEERTLTRELADWDELD
jgi:hypothetical protein